MWQVQTWPTKPQNINFSRHPTFGVSRKCPPSWEYLLILTFPLNNDESQGQKVLTLGK